MPLGAGEQFAGYTIVRLLGSGGMGEVYLAKHPRLPRHDALKVLPAAISNDADFRSRFEREADLAGTLWHPHVVGVHDRGEFEGRLWISMDYVEGSDTAKLCREQFPHGMPARDVADIVVAVAEALDYAHEQRLLHRDVKPGNILVTGTSRAKRRILLADFGIARQTDHVSGLTATNMTVGSVHYTAPEQLVGEPLDGRADQYSLAATAYHLLTGSPPFAHSNSAVVISRHLSNPPPHVADVHPGLAPLDAVLAKALSKTPADRYDTCVDFAAALHTATDGVGQDSDATVVAQPVTASAAEPAAQRIAAEDAPTQHIAAVAAEQPTTANQAAPVAVSSWGAPQRFTPPVQAPTTDHPPPPTNTSALNLKWVAAAAALVLIAVGVTIAVIGTGGERTSRAPSAPATGYASNDTEAASDEPSTADRPGWTTPTSSSSPVSIRPPGLVQTPDTYQEQCGNGIPMPGKSGWAAHGGRGTEATTCYFVYSVLKAYWDRYPTPARDRRQVIAQGRVACDPTNAQCSGDDYVIDCQAIGAEPWITCAGGHDARVYVY
jgi:serine/threonine protein kinase, bacterial